MTQAQVTVKFDNDPRGNSKFRSINCDGIYYSYDPTKIARFEKGRTYLIEYESKPYNGKDYHTVTAVLSSAPQAEATAQHSPTSDHMSKDDWAAKDRHITRVAIAKSCIEANASTDVADAWIGWIYNP